MLYEFTVRSEILSFAIGTFYNSKYWSKYEMIPVKQWYGLWLEKSHYRSIRSNMFCSNNVFSEYESR